MNSKKLLKPLNDDELHQLDELLLDYAAEDDAQAIMSISRLDGFLAAILSGPRTISPTDWLPVLWTSGAPDCETEQELELFFNLILRHANHVNSNLNNELDDLPMIIDTRHQANGDEILVAEDWCFGYMRAVQYANWSEMDEDGKNALAKIALHGLVENLPTLEKLTTEQHQESVYELADAAATLFRYWLPRREAVANTTPIRVVKTGRNEPCPCGSGKKFKHCCLH